MVFDVSCTFFAWNRVESLAKCGEGAKVEAKQEKERRSKARLSEIAIAQAQAQGVAIELSRALQYIVLYDTYIDIYMYMIYIYVYIRIVLYDKLCHLTYGITLH